MSSIEKFELDFKTLETEVFNYVCKLGIHIIEGMLKSLDKELGEKRDKDEYRHKGLKQNTIKTVMGSVEYRRAIYEHIDDGGNKKYVYLLDEFLNMETIGKMSANLVEKVLENVSVASYRRSADNVSSITGQSISHGAAWGIVQSFGGKLEKEEKEKIEQFEEGKLNGERKVEVLFMEADGLWLNMQRKDRPKVGSKREIKLGIHYEGWKLRSGKKKSYILKNKRVIAGFTSPEKFKLLRDASIAEEYNDDEIKYKILNGDGATWIKSDHDSKRDYFQLDRFHIARAILRCIKDKEESRKLWKMFKKGQLKSFMERLTELKYECGGVYEDVKKIEELENYLISNKDGIIPYKQRITLTEPEEGVYYRGLGAMESNVFTVVGYRMKGQRMSWTIKGANNLAKILATKTSGKLYDKIGSLLSSKLPEKAVEVYETVIKNVKEVGKKIRKRVDLYPVQEGTKPFTGVPLTEGRKAIRRMLDDKPLSEIIYR
jgi:hypothetical protein